jgi:pyruvate formate lyase activating enzyme
MHLIYTGVPSKPILANLARLLKSGSNVVVRVPLIPGCNYSASDVTSIGRRALELGATRISLLPFNPASAGKYSWLHRPYPLPGAKRQGDQHVHELENMLREQGLEVVEP